MRFKLIGLGRLDETVKECAGRSPFRSSPKNPVLSSNHEGPDGVFSGIVVGCQPPIGKVSYEPIPLVQSICDCLAQQTLGRSLGCFFKQPVMKFLKDRLGLFLTEPINHIRGQSLNTALYFVEFSDIGQSHVSTPGLPALALSLDDINELPPSMNVTSYYGRALEEGTSRAGKNAL